MLRACFFGMPIWLAVAGGFQVPTLLQHAAWAGERATVMGHIDRIVIGRKIMETFYSYSVDGRDYTGEVVDANGFVEGTPETVTYAKSNPGVSTIVPSEIEKLYVTSVVITIFAVLPLVILAVLDIKRRYTLKG
jgi:hypothetical protein